MKRRQGFVSNSSSSSFVVGFLQDSLPTTEEEMHRLLFGDPVEATINSEHGGSFSADVVAGVAWRDFFAAKPLEWDAVATELEDSGEEIDFFGDVGTYAEKYFPGIDVYGGENSTREHIWEQYERERRKAALDFAYRLKQQHADKVFYLFMYSDNDGSLGSFMEHGDIFRNVFHIRISHH